MPPIGEDGDTDLQHDQQHEDKHEAYDGVLERFFSVLMFLRFACAGIFHAEQDAEDSTHGADNSQQSGDKDLADFDDRSNDLVHFRSRHTNERVKHNILPSL